MASFILLENGVDEIELEDSSGVIGLESIVDGIGSAVGAAVVSGAGKALTHAVGSVVGSAEVAGESPFSPFLTADFVGGFYTLDGSTVTLADLFVANPNMSGAALVIDSLGLLVESADGTTTGSIAVSTTAVNSAVAATLPNGFVVVMAYSLQAVDPSLTPTTLFTLDPVSYNGPYEISFFDDETSSLGRVQYDDLQVFNNVSTYPTQNRIAFRYAFPSIATVALAVNCSAPVTNTSIGEPSVTTVNDIVLAAPAQPQFEAHIQYLAIYKSTDVSDMSLRDLGCSDGPAIGHAVGSSTVTGVSPRAHVGSAVGEAAVSGVPLITHFGAAVGSSFVRGTAQPIVNTANAFPPGGPTSLTKVIPSYLYVQYNDDDNLQGMVKAYNAYAQAYVDWFNQLNLPIYTGANIAGSLLDWVATNLYGLARPVLSQGGRPMVGPLNSWRLNTIPLNGYVAGAAESFTPTTDDVYKRILTYLFFKGDGFQWSINWLKRRIMRFLFGQSGTDYLIDETYPVSIAFTAARRATITLPDGYMSTIFAEAVASNIVPLPFQVTWTIVVP